MKNKVIRTAAKECGIRLWEIADALGIHDSAFSRKLRYELPEEEQRQILDIISRLAREESE